MTINNNNIFGAFTLGEVRSGRLTGEWLNKESVANYGWFGGGNPGPLSTVDRIDFSNDSVTASPRGPLFAARSSFTAVSNANYGWFAGGSTTLTPPTSTTVVDRIDFSNDFSTATLKGPLTLAKLSFAAVGNSNYGWFGGGAINPSSILSSIDRINFSNDSSTASPRGPLSLARIQLAATGNSNYGWFGLGTVDFTPNGVSYSVLDRIDFSNDSSMALSRGVLTLSRKFLASVGNSNYGWYGGGSIPGSPLEPVVSTVERIDFSNDLATGLVRGPLSLAKYGMGSVSNFQYGWFGAGTVPGPPIYSSVERIDFSNDSVTASSRGSLTLAKFNLAATSGVLNIRRQKGGNFGWIGGGIDQSPFPVAWVSRVDRIDFSNDSVTASIRGPLSSVRGELAATGNSNYGWFGGGTTPTPTTLSTVDRIDFSNDSATASPRGRLTLARSNLTATGNSNYGWFGGGFAPSIPGVTSRVDRIDFSNDSGTASVRGPLSLARSFLAATGNSNYGWFGGNTSTVNRIDFSSDSPTALVRGPLTSGRYALASTGNSNYGWFGGGSFPYSAAVDRIDFSNDSATASPRGSLTLARRYVTATGNSNYGWWGSGQAGGPPFSTVDRINFSNDSVTASPRGPLSLGRVYTSATSNTPVG